MTFKCSSSETSWLCRYIHKPATPDEPPLTEQPKPLHPYRTVGCVFNHQMFLGNCQPSDAVETCIFDLNDESKWKPMSEEAIKSVCAPGATTSLPPFPPLCASTVDASVTSNEIEMQLRLLVSEHRKVSPGSHCSFICAFLCSFMLLFSGRGHSRQYSSLNTVSPVPAFWSLRFWKLWELSSETENFPSLLF